MKRLAAKFVPRALTDTTMHVHTQPSLLYSFWLKMAWFCCSMHLTLCDFFLFSRMKRGMTGHRFDNIEEVKKKKQERTCQPFLKMTTKKRFEQWKHRWDKCISCNGEYFEGDKVVL